MLDINPIFRMTGFQVVVRTGLGVLETKRAQWSQQHHCPVVDGVVLYSQCYCACPVPYDNTYSTWLAVFAQPITPGDKPLHAADLAFPLYLPLYPDKPIVLMAFQVRLLETGAPRPVYLSWPPEGVVQPLRPLHVTAQLWEMAALQWSAAVASLRLLSWLSYAFDSSVVSDEAAVEDEEDGLVKEDELMPVVPFEKDKACVLATDEGNNSDTDEDDRAGKNKDTDSSSDSENDFDYEGNSEEEEEEEEEDESEPDEKDDV
jgi:hypothetical protein